MPSTALNWGGGSRPLNLALPFLSWHWLPKVRTLRMGGLWWGLSSSSWGMGKARGGPGFLLSLSPNRRVRCIPCFLSPQNLPRPKGNMTRSKRGEAAKWRLLAGSIQDAPFRGGHLSSTEPTFLSVGVIAGNGMKDTVGW